LFNQHNIIILLNAQELLYYRVHQLVLFEKKITLYCNNYLIFNKTCYTHRVEVNLTNIFKFDDNCIILIVDFIFLRLPHIMFYSLNQSIYKSRLRYF